MFFENNTRETWLDAKYLGGLDELEANRPKVKKRIYDLYNCFASCLRDADEMRPIKSDAILKAVSVLNYEPDKAVKVIQSADDHYRKLYAEKLKRMNSNGR